MASEQDIARALERDGEYEQATALYKKFITQEPNMPSHYAGLAYIYEKMNELSLAQDALDQAPQILQNSAHILYTRAKLAHREKHYDQALAFLHKAEQATKSDQAFLLCLIYHERGFLLQALKRYDEAITAFEQGNAHHKKTKSFRDITSRQSNAGRMRHFKQLFTQSFIAQCTKPPKPDRPAPVMLVGFPRSGTTLLERMLDVHPRIQTLSETQTLTNTINYMHEKIGRFLPNIPSLKRTDLQDIQAYYFNESAKHALIIGKQIILDKNPLNIVHLGGLSCFFKKPKIILLLRHPCDCVLSAFKQKFSLNTDTVHMLSLADTAKYYKEVFDLMAHYQSVLDMDVCTIRYEDLIANPAEQLKNILDFMDLPWRDDLLDHARHNQDKYISSASYRQASQPVYDSAVEQWRAYKKHIQPHLNILQPYIQKFGYKI